MIDGWILLHRKLLENPIFLKPELLQLFIYCLLKANHEPNRIIFNGKEIVIQKGQFITGRETLSRELKQNGLTTYKRLKILQNLEILNIKSNNRFSLVTIENYRFYQEIIKKRNNKKNNKGTTREQQGNTNKEDLYTDTLNKLDTLNNIDQSVSQSYIDQSVSQSYKEKTKTLQSNANVTTFFKADKCRTDGRQMTDKCPTNDRQMLEKIIKAAQIENYPETTALFIQGVIKKLINDSAIPVKWQMEMTYQEIIRRLRLCRDKHIESAMLKMENCKTNKEIYFAKCLLTAIVERSIEEIFEEGGEV
jgi:hypothetical protein